ncbi:MAG: 3-hydroxyacyl-CoA dehydrogenase, partial [Bacteroidales bacterium]|nr:3-hydroxyacyl-CoA dehydrogenase [Bacteroidales bacterium]
LGKMVPFPQRLGRPGEYAMLARHIIENRHKIVRLGAPLDLR